MASQGVQQARDSTKEFCWTVCYGQSKLGHKGEELFYLVLLGSQKFKLSRARSQFGTSRVRIFFTLIRIVISPLVFIQFRLFSLGFI